MIAIAQIVGACAIVIAISRLTEAQVAGRHKHHKGRLNAVWLVVGAGKEAQGRANVGTR